MATPVRDWLIFIGGFMQDRSEATYGMCGLAHSCLARYPDVLVSYEPWKSDWNATAEWVYRWSYVDSGPRPRIMLVAYSWGGGWGLIQLCRYLQMRDLYVDVAVVSDAVRHVGWQWARYLGISQVCAYFPHWKNIRPPNIGTFDWFIQSRKRNLFRDWKDGTTWLYGHPWVDEDGKPTGNRHDVPTASHTNMDDCQDFRTKVYARADELFLSRSVA